MTLIPDKELRFWERSGQPGQATYANAEELRQDFCAAFDWLAAHPLKEEQIFHNKGEVVRTYVRRMRPFTWDGVSLYMGMDSATLHRYRRNPEFAGVMEWAAMVIRTQKFEGAAAGFLKEGIISRDLGLAERHEVSGPDGGPIKTTELDAEQALIEEALRLGMDPSALGLGDVGS